MAPYIVEIIAQAAAPQTTEAYNAIWIMVAGGLAIFFTTWLAWLSKTTLSGAAKIDVLSNKVDHMSESLKDAVKKIDAFYEFKATGKK